MKIEAIKQTRKAMKYINNPTKEMRLLAVKPKNNH